MDKILFSYDHNPVLKPITIDTHRGSYLQNIKGWLTTRKWELTQDFHFNINNFNCYIPKGFIFDGASIPRFLWFFLHPTGILLIPALIHDYGYQKGIMHTLGKIDAFESFDRKNWDELFVRISYTINGFYLLNKLAYFGVRLGGWIAYTKYRKS